MREKQIEELLRWKRSPRRRPLIIGGTLQVGKTWLMKEFGRRHYAHTAYIDLASNTALRGMLRPEPDVRGILMALAIAAGAPIKPGRTLVLFDRLEAAPGALVGLAAFHKQAPGYHLIAATSRIDGNAFPSGRLAFLQLRPLDFTEFVEAVDDGSLAGLLISSDWKKIRAHSSHFIRLLKWYCYVGGMPEAVSSFSQHRDPEIVRAVQKRILSVYEGTLARQEIPRLQMLWRSIPSQLAKPNRKFMYGHIRKGSRAGEYEKALGWLLENGLVYKVNTVGRPGLQLKAEEDQSAFKLFLPDTGLFAAMADIGSGGLLEDSRLFEECNGSLTEQYVLQQLMGNKEAGIYYWSADKARATMDFVVQYWGKAIPVEVMAKENLQAKSGKVYHQKFRPSQSIRTSLSDYRRTRWMINIPLYAIGGGF